MSGLGTRRFAGGLAAAAFVVSAFTGSGISDEIIGPVGEPSHEVPVGLNEWSIVLAGPTAGEVTLVVTNAGGTVHDLEVEGRLGTWATPMLGPGETYELVVEVEAGEALHLHCTVPGHHSNGMHVYLMAHG